MDWALIYIYGERKYKKGEVQMKTEKRMEVSLLATIARILRVGMDEEVNSLIPQCTAFLHQPKRPKHRKD